MLPSLKRFVFAYNSLLVVGVISCALSPMSLAGQDIKQEQEEILKRKTEAREATKGQEDARELKKMPLEGEIDTPSSKDEESQGETTNPLNQTQDAFRHPLPLLSLHSGGLEAIFSFLDLAEQGRMAQTCNSLQVFSYNARVWRELLGRIKVRAAEGKSARESFFLECDAGNPLALLEKGDLYCKVAYFKQENLRKALDVYERVIGSQNVDITHRKEAELRKYFLMVKYNFFPTMPGIIRDERPYHETFSRLRDYVQSPDSNDCQKAQARILQARIRIFNFLDDELDNDEPDEEELLTHQDALQYLTGAIDRGDLPHDKKQEAYILKAIMRAAGLIGPDTCSDQEAFQLLTHARESGTLSLSDRALADCWRASLRFRNLAGADVLSAQQLFDLATALSENTLLTEVNRALADYWRASLRFNNRAGADALSDQQLFDLLTALSENLHLLEDCRALAGFWRASLRFNNRAGADALSDQQLFDLLTALSENLHLHENYRARAGFWRASLRFNNRAGADALSDQQLFDLLTALSENLHLPENYRALAGFERVYLQFHNGAGHLSPQQLFDLITTLSENPHLPENYRALAHSWRARLQFNDRADADALSDQ